MKIRNLRRAFSLQTGLAALLLAGCQQSSRPERAIEKVDPGTLGMPDETQRVAEAALGKQAEILARGDLARNKAEQLLVVNRFAKGQHGVLGPGNDPAIIITRAAVLEKSNGKWSEVLLCDEYLKNPNGYLGGSPVTRVNGWRLEFEPNTKQGLELKFTPKDVETGTQESGTGEPARKTIVVRWNTRSKRYQSIDPSHERYLGEAPTLETPHSILR